MTSVFAKYQSKSYPYKWSGTLHLHSVAGGVPLDPKVLEGHLKRKIAAPDDLIRAEIAETMLERGMEGNEAVAAVAALKGLVGFRQDGDGLYLGGYQLKASLKEAASIAVNVDKLKSGNKTTRDEESSRWGTNYAKGLKSWMPEHVFVMEDKLHLGRQECDEVVQSFIHKMTAKGPVNAIQYTEVVYDVDVPFTVETDHDFTPEQWAMIWTTGEKNGLGSSRKMGYGRYEVTQWKKVKVA